MFNKFQYFQGDKKPVMLLKSRSFQKNVCAREICWLAFQILTQWISSTLFLTEYDQIFQIFFQQLAIKK